MDQRFLNSFSGFMAVHIVLRDFADYRPRSIDRSKFDDMWGMFYRFEKVKEIGGG